VTLEELYTGKTTKLSLSKTVICPKCEGRGGKEGAVKQCKTCNGTGVRLIVRQLGPMLQQIQQYCNECNGEGNIIRESDKCKECKAKKTITERKVLEVHIDKGMKQGQKIVFNGEADQKPGEEPGDVIIELHEKPHDRFIRRGDDLYYVAKIDLLTALAGGQFNIKHLDDKVLLVTVLPGEAIKPGQFKRIPEFGMPSYRHHNFGSLLIKFDIQFPDPNWIAPETIAQLEQILPPRQQQIEMASSTDQVEEVVLQTLDKASEQKAEHILVNGVSDDDDEDEGRHGGVQCAQQ
jgi:DnaJ family protein A protein 2